MDQPQHYFSPFISVQYPSTSEQSLVQSLRCEATIADLTYRITSVSQFLVAVQQVLDFVAASNSFFSLYQEQIIILVELGRKTLESLGVVVYDWASCTTELAAHKEAYFRLLKMLQSNERYVDTQLQRRLRVLLMPLTSQFSKSKEPKPGQPFLHMAQTALDSRVPSSFLYLPEHTNRMPAPHASASSVRTMMPPPDTYPSYEQANIDAHIVNDPIPSNRQLWEISELIPRRARKSRSPSPATVSHDEVDSSQNKLDPELIPFRQAPARQRFGIFLKGKSSMHLTQDRKGRSGRPTH